MSLVGINVTTVTGDESEDEGESVIASAPPGDKVVRIGDDPNVIEVSPVRRLGDGGNHVVANPNATEFDLHPPLSPSGGAESLFMMGLDTSNISATALAQQIRMNHQSPMNGGGGLSSIFGSATSVVTDDFVSACDDDNSTDSDEDLQKDNVANILQRDVLTHLQDPILERLDEQTEPAAADSIITNRLKEELRGKNSNRGSEPESTTRFEEIEDERQLESKSRALPFLEDDKMSSAPVTPTTTTKEGVHLDAVENVYEAGKGVWDWGKGVGVVKPFLGLAEGVASKVVGLAGTNLEEIDGAIKPQLKSIDESVLNPVVDAVVGIVLGAVSKTEDVIKPLVLTIIKPLDFMIKNEAETDSTKTMDKKLEQEKVAPEVTSVAVN